MQICDPSNRAGDKRQAHKHIAIAPKANDDDFGFQIQAKSAADFAKAATARIQHQGRKPKKDAKALACDANPEGAGSEQGVISDSDKQRRCPFGSNGGAQETEQFCNIIAGDEQSLQKIFLF